MTFGTRLFTIWIPTSSLYRYVILGKVFNCSMPQLPPLENEHNNGTYILIKYFNICKIHIIITSSSKKSKYLITTHTSFSAILYLISILSPSSLVTPTTHLPGYPFIPWFCSGKVAIASGVYSFTTQSQFYRFCWAQLGP